MKHIAGILNLGCHFGSRLGAPLLFLAMPAILSTELATWRVVARRWRRGNRGREASVLPREERLASLAARGAYIESQWHQVYRAPDIPADWCRTCAQWTTSWCEGCYSRCGRGGEPFGAICHQCDSEKRVCDKCTTQGISWDQGHERYVADHGGEQEAAVQIEGFGTQESAPHFHEVDNRPQHVRRRRARLHHRAAQER